MPQKIDADSTSGEKLLRLFRKLMIEGRRHFQVDLAKEFQCSTQTIIRLISEIENVVGIALESGIENRKKWYQMKSLNRARFGLEFEELRYLALCRDMAEPILPQNILERVDNTLLELSILMADKDFDVRERVQEEQFPFFSKGKIDYSLFFDYIETLQKAIENKQFCLLRYKPAGKEERECRFAPSRIIAMNNALYILGADVDNTFKNIIKLRSLAVHRLKDCVLVDKNFDIDFPPVETNSFGLPWHEVREYRIHFTEPNSIDYVKERRWAREQSIEELEDKSIILTIKSTSEPEVLAWVRSFGEGVELL